MFSDIELTSDHNAPNCPFPDIVAPGDTPWKKVIALNPLTSMCDFKGRVIVAPSGNDHMSKIIRTHEMAHARFTKVDFSDEQKKALERIHPAAFQIAEDCLITYELNGLGLPAPCNCSVCREQAEMMTTMTARHVMIGMEEREAREVATIWTQVKMGQMTELNLPPDPHSPEREYRERGMPAGHHPITQAVYEIIQSPKIAPIQKRIEIAELLTLAGTRRKLPSKPPKPLKMKQEEGEPDWRKMTIFHPPLIVDHRTRAYVNRISDTGAIPKYMHRLPLDMKIFGNRKRINRGNVLIDCSGSMGLNDEDLEKLIKRFPAGKVAGYSGGELVILAEDGKMVKEIPEWDDSNECDGPALEWLEKQSGPKFWVSDGCVTEQGDEFTSRALKACLEIVNRAGIKQVTQIKKMFLGKEG